MRRIKGYTLIELLIATGLGIFLLSGVVQIFNSNSQSIRLVNASARVQEGGRIAMEMLTRDIRMADYWGCAPDPSTITNHLKTDGSDTDYDPDIHNPQTGSGLGGLNDVGVLTIGDAITGTERTVLPGTDVIILKGSRRWNGVSVIPPYMPMPAGALQLNNGNDIPQGTILLVSNCSGGDFFSNTATQTLTNGTVTHNTGVDTGTMVQNDTKNFSQTYEGDAVISSPYTKTYFLGVNGSGGTSLYRYGNENDQMLELVPNITDLQFVYGEDTSNDLAANVFRDAATVADMDDVMAIQVTINVESPNGSNTLAREYKSTATIRNRLL